MSSRDRNWNRNRNQGGVARKLRSLAWLVLIAATMTCAGARAERGMGEEAVTDAGNGPDASLDARHARASQEVAQLQRRYGQATDQISRDAPENTARTLTEYRRIFTADAEIGVKDQLSVTGPDAWLEIVKATQSNLLGSQHLIGSQVVDIAELPDLQGRGGAASMTSYLMASQIGADGRRTTILGTYVSEVTFSPRAGWQMSKMTLQLLSVDAPPAAQ